MAAEGSNPLPKTSPFSPAGGPAATVGAPAESIEFAAVSTIGKKTELVFKNKDSKKTSWIAKGETKDGISVVNYDGDREQAVVKFNGVEKVLSLRKASSGGGGPKPVAPIQVGFNAPAPQPAFTTVPPTTNVAVNAVPAVAAPATPQSEQQKQETEARMLVSDLLEIGMAQRRAYEEAQRKTSEGGSAAATPAQTPAGQP